MPLSCCRVAEQAGRAAKAAGSKLKEGASELAANLTSWWANLEPADRFALPGVSTQSKHQVGMWSLWLGGQRWKAGRGAGSQDSFCVPMHQLVGGVGWLDWVRGWLSDC